MTINNSFPVIFDKVHSISCYNGNPCKWTIVENSNSSKIKYLHVYFTSDDYICFDEKVVKKMPDLTKSRSSLLLDDDCDGIGIFQKGTGTYFLFVDLKSNFDTNKIQHGFIQGLSSFFKLHSMLSLCDGYNIDDTNIEFVVACCCFQNKDKESEVIHWMWKQNELDSKSFVSKVAYPLYQSGSIIIKIGEIPQFSSLPFNNHIINKEVKLTLVRSSDYGHDFAEYYL